MDIQALHRYQFKSDGQVPTDLGRSNTNNEGHNSGGNSPQHKGMPPRIPSLLIVDVMLAIWYLVPIFFLIVHECSQIRLMKPGKQVPGYNPSKWWSNISSPCEDALAIVWVPLGREAVECEDARVVLGVYKEAEPLCN
jgi:hypothetical protein